jgi:hypothetical protein
MESSICFGVYSGIDVRPWFGASPLDNLSGKQCKHVTRKMRRFSMAAAAAGDRALWAESISKTYDGSRYQFKDVTLSIPIGAKIALLGANGGKKIDPSPSFPRGFARKMENQLVDVIADLSLFVVHTRVWP